MSSIARKVLCFAGLLAVASGGLHPSALGDGRADAPAPASAMSAPVVTPASPWYSTDQPSHRTATSGVPDFGILNSQVWRSGQPCRKGYEKLAQMGVKTIVNLRAEFPQEKDQVPSGVHYIQIPIVDQTAPTVEQAEQFLSIVTNPDNWPVLVHCRAGEGRTGVMCALVRYAIDGWDDKRITAEIGRFRSTRMCGCQRQFLKEWATHNAPGSWRARIGAQQPQQP
jgi:protein-tyrosine phosphatase